MKDDRKEWRRSLWEKKEQARQALILQAARRQAVRYIRWLQQMFPKNSLIQLLFVMLKDGQLLACQMAIDAIERNQGSVLSAKDRDFLQKMRTQLAERQGQGTCPVKNQPIHV